MRHGPGYLDYKTYLRELAKLEPDVPLMVEHLPNAEEYTLAANHRRALAKQIGMAL